MSKEAFLNRIKSRPYEYNIFLVAAIVRDYQVDLSKVKNDDTFTTTTP